MASVHYHIKLNPDKDAAIIERINQQDNKNQYIRELVLSDIAADSLMGMMHLDPEPDPDLLEQVKEMEVELDR